MKSIDDVKKLLEDSKEDQVEIKESNILFLDVSSTCTGYAVAAIDFKKRSAKFLSSGCIWFDKSWTHQEKYHYIGASIPNYFWIIEKIDYIVIEQYSLNPKKMMGVHVVPEMCGAIKAYAHEHGITVDSFLPQSWRSELGIKKVDGDFKKPTKIKILEEADVPEEVTSNITHKIRKTPSDLYDALGIGWGWLKRLGIKKFSFKDMTYNKHVGTLQKEV